MCGPVTGHRPSARLHAVAALAVTLPLLAVRRWPLPALLLVVAGAALDQALGGGLGQVWFALLLAVFGLGRYAGPRASAAGAVLVACGVLAVDLPAAAGRRTRSTRSCPGGSSWPAPGAWAVGSGGAGAEHDRLVDHNSALERDRDAATRAAVAYERTRIATELHDLVAHAMAVIVLQAQAAGRVLDTDPRAAADALRAIELVGRQGLVEMRRLRRRARRRRRRRPRRSARACGTSTTWSTRCARPGSRSSSR